MTPDRRADRAILLAAIALLGLVVAPLLHAAEHAREADEDERESLAVAWGTAPGDSLDALAFALEHPHQEPRGGEHGHSHAPAGSGAHGAGTLLHLGVALHAAPQLPEVAGAAPVHALPRAMRGQLQGTLPHLVPERSQAPPSRC
jgi:hypothetical protein